MSITDELREWSKNWSATNRSLDDIADRIDETYIRDVKTAFATVENLLELKCTECERIELPKDKNGKTIHVSDRLKLANRISTVVVASITYIENGNVLVRPLDSGIAIPFRSSELIEPDTQEKLNHDVRSLFDCNVDVTPEIIQDLLRRQRALDGVK